MHILTIDGRPVSYKEGETVLEAARHAGIPIPTLCFHRRTGVIASCRICVVEVEGMEGVQASCSLPAVKGMVVRSSSANLLEVRRAVLRLALASGRHDCDECAADEDCELQRAARQLDVDMKSVDPGRGHDAADRSAPMIERHADKCILCGRCVVGCRAIAVHEVLAMAERGSKKRLVCDDDRPMGESSCVQCGECVQLCPTGALVDSGEFPPVKPGERKEVETTCPYCGVGCGLTLRVRTGDRRIVGVTGTEGHVVNDGSLCVKGRYGYGFIQSDERLSRPLSRRGDGSLGEVTWEEAISRAAESFRKIVNTSGPEALAGLSSAKCTNEENYLFQKLFRQVLGTNSVDHCARLCHSSTVTAMSSSLGSGAMTNDIAGIPEAEVILVIGSDTASAHPVIASAIRRAVKSGKTKLIVIDPRRTGISRGADIYARHRCGTDVAVINGLIHLILKEGLEDRPFIESRCEGFDALRVEVEKYTPDIVEEISGVPADSLLSIARLFGKAEPGAVFYAMGITQHTTGTDNVQSLVNLQLLCGNFGRPGGGLNPLRGQCNVQGACDMGALPEVLPGYVKISDGRGLALFGDAWGAALPAERGLTSMEMIESASAGRLQGLYVMGENPCLSDPDIGHVKKALSRLDFLVVQDIFLTETAEVADLILPAASFAEKDGHFTNTERRVQRIRRAVPPPGEAREDWRIIQEVACALGAEWRYDSARDIQEEIGRLVPAYGGISWERTAEKGLQWPCPDVSHPGTEILHRDAFPRGKGLMKAVAWRPPAEVPDEEYPMVLTTGRLLAQFHTGTMTRRCRGIDGIAGPHVALSREDAASLGVADGEMVEVSTRRGSLSAPARVTCDVPAGTVYIPFHFREAAANVLTNSALDPQAKIPEYKVCAVRLKRLNVS